MPYLCRLGRLATRPTCQSALVGSTCHEGVGKRKLALLIPRTPVRTKEGWYAPSPSPRSGSPGLPRASSDKVGEGQSSWQWRESKIGDETHGSIGGEPGEGTVFAPDLAGGGEAVEGRHAGGGEIGEWAVVK